MNDELEVFVQTRWRCPACRRSYSRRGTAVNHQAVCARDPDNRSCRTCVHNPYPDYDYSDQCEAGEMPFDPFTGKPKLHCLSWAAVSLPVEEQQ